MKSVYRIPVILAVIGAYLNTADLLATFQPTGRAWVGWVGAASLAIGLLVTSEELAKHGASGGIVLVCAVLVFGTAELTGQVLHSAMVSGDYYVLNDTWRWILSYVSPSVPVLVGVAMPFIVKYGGLGEHEGQKKQRLANYQTHVKTHDDRAGGRRMGKGDLSSRVKSRVPATQLALDLAEDEPIKANGKVQVGVQR